MPSTPKCSNADWTLKRCQAKSFSSFTGLHQFIDHPGKWWLCTLKYPPMTLLQAQDWIDFLMKLHGQIGTFYLTDPDGNIKRGNPLGTPLVTAFGSDRLSVTTYGWTANKAGLLYPGDWISFSNYEYKRVVESIVNSDSGGAATIYFEPIMRVPLAGGTAIATTSAKGIFHLESHDVAWTTDNLMMYGLTLAIMEELS